MQFGDWLRTLAGGSAAAGRGKLEPSLFSSTQGENNERASLFSMPGGSRNPVRYGWKHRITPKYRYPTRIRTIELIARRAGWCDDRRSRWKASFNGSAPRQGLTVKDRQFAR